MSESSAGISYRVQQLGAEGVRQRLREINTELQHGAPVTKALKTEIRELGVQVSSQNRVVKLSSQAWLENHRTLQSAGRVMSAVSSIARSALAITTAWSIATLAFGGTNVRLMELRQELERVNAQLADTGLSDEERAALEERRNIIEAEIKQLNSEEMQGAITNAVNLAATIAIIGSSAIQAAPKIASLIRKGGPLEGLMSFLGGKDAGKKLAGIALIGLGATGLLTGGIDAMTGASEKLEDKLKAIAGTAAIGVGIALEFPGLAKIALIGTAIATATVAIIVFRKEIGDFFTWFEETSGLHGEEVILALTHPWTLIYFLFKDIWDAIGTELKNQLTSWLDSIKKFGANALAELARVLGFKKDENKASVKAGIGAKTIRGRAGGGLITEPVIGVGQRTGDLWTLGENGPEMVMPIRGGSGGGNTYNFNFNVNGDISGEELIRKVRMAIKDNLRDRGFTGF